MTFLDDLMSEKSVNKTQYQNLKTCELDSNSTCQIYNQNFSLKAPLFIALNRSIMFEKSLPFFLDFRKDKLENKQFAHIFGSKGFSHLTEHSNRYGYIGYNISDYFVIRFNPDEIRSHFQNGLIEIEYLGSYENIGKMAISIYFSPVTLKSNATHVQHVISKTVDCQWNTKVSISATTQLEVQKKNFNISYNFLYINVTIVKADEFRLVNKIKIFQVTIF